MVMFMYLTALIIVRKGEMNLIYCYHTGQFFLNNNQITIHYHFQNLSHPYRKRRMIIVIHIGN